MPIHQYIFQKSVSLVPDSVNSYETLDQVTLEECIDLPSSFQLRITIPVQNAYVVSINRETLDSCQIKDILNLFRIHYRQMYDLEEKTHQASFLEFVCNKCLYPNLRMIERNYDFERENAEKCCICHSERTSSKIILNCKHKYHFKCLFKWFSQSNECPLCKSPIKECLDCDSKRFIRIPFEQDQIAPRLEAGQTRISSRGLFGIHDHYFEDLVFNSITFDNETNILSIL